MTISCYLNYSVYLQPNLLAKQGGVCAVINKNCCTYINNSGQIGKNIAKLYQQAKGLHAFRKKRLSSQAHLVSLQSCLSFYELVPPAPWPLLMLFFFLIFNPCLFNLVKFVSSRIQKFHLQMVIHQGFQPNSSGDNKSQQWSLDQVVWSFYPLVATPFTTP